MIFFWFLYFIFLIILCLIFINLFKNKYVIFLLTPILFGLFGSVWFQEPGKNDLAPIFSIFLMELVIVESNGTYRLLRPMIGFILVALLVSIVLYFRPIKSKKR
ncbi:hypothetical protein N9T42_03950 [SAR86 cluster bacterium]|nr:hypothetical protein [SAR86 cluster bacterium]